MKMCFVIVLFLTGRALFGQEIQDTTAVSEPKGIVCYSSISKADFPLIIIDGVPADPDKELAIKPRQIAKITFLEGMHATALYGFRASVHGVLLIETKRGKKPKAKRRESDPEDSFTWSAG